MSLSRTRQPPLARTFTVEVAKAVWRGDYTYLEDPLVNGNPEAVVPVTQNWNPGGGRLQRPPRERRVRHRARQVVGLQHRPCAYEGRGRLQHGGLLAGPRPGGLGDLTVEHRSYADFVKTLQAK